MRGVRRAASAWRSDADRPSPPLLAAAHGMNGPATGTVAAPPRAVGPAHAKAGPLRAFPHKSDFEKALAAPPRSRSAHFAVHHVASGPCDAPKWQGRTHPQNLSTGAAPDGSRPVDKLLLPRGHWLGSVVPKRHAKRAVTRSLLKRQIRAAVARQVEAGALPPGLWLVRLKAPFATAQFPSAASDALRRAARGELDALLAGAPRAARGGKAGPSEAAASR